jgi:hypothetical protein
MPCPAYGRETRRAKPADSFDALLVASPKMGCSKVARARAIIVGTTLPVMLPASMPANGTRSRRAKERLYRVGGGRGPGEIAAMLNDGVLEVRLRKTEPREAGGSQDPGQCKLRRAPRASCRPAEQPKSDVLRLGSPAGVVGGSQAAEATTRQATDTQLRQ